MSGTSGPLATSLKGLFQRQQSPSAPLPALTAKANSAEIPRSPASAGVPKPVCSRYTYSMLLVVEQSKGIAERQCVTVACGPQ